MNGFSNPFKTNVFGGSSSFGNSSLRIRKTSKRKKRKNKLKTKNRKSTYNRMSNKRIRRTPRTAGKKKDRSMKRIRYTKNGQPYVIKANGRACFIKKKTAKTSHKKKGGRY